MNKNWFEKIIDYISKFFITIAKIIKYFIRLVFIIAIFVIVVWSLNLAHDGIRDMFFSTSETNYETQLTEKARSLLDIMLQGDDYLIVTTVKFREKIEKIQQRVHDPKELEEVKTSSITKEKTKAPHRNTVLLEEGETIDLPGMKELITTTNRYALDEKYGVEHKESELEQVDQSSKTYYFDEKKIEVSYDRESLELIKIVVLIDPETLTKSGLSLTDVRSSLLDVLPLDIDRGDRLSIRSQVIELNPTFFDVIVSGIKATYVFIIEKIINPIVWLIQLCIDHWKLIATIAAIIVGIPIAIFLIKLIIKWIKYLLQKRAERLAEQAKMEKEQEFKLDRTGKPESYPESVLTVLKTKKQESAEVLKYWMGLDKNE